MSGSVLNDGAPIAVSSTRARIGAGPWARHLAVAVVGDETSQAALDGAALARAGAVHAVRVETGAIFAEVSIGAGETCSVSLLAALVPSGIWTAVVRFARNRASLQAGVEARTQSEQLEHLLTEDWEEPLVPGSHAIARACSCDAHGDCEHVAALGYVVADAIDGDPSLLLRWRGCVENTGPSHSDPWRGGVLPELEPSRPYPAGTVLMRLGESGIRSGDADLADVLQRAYEAFAAPEGDES